jgi:outer membrane protein
VWLFIIGGLKMKRLLLWVVGICCATLWSVSSLAAGVAVIDMQQIFQSSKQVKDINDGLEKQFAAQKKDVDTLGKQLQANVDKYKKDQAVMDAKAAEALKNTIRDQEQKLQQQQTDLQRKLFDAQNKAMTQFLDKIKDIVKGMASTQDIDVVLPKNALLYSKDNLDITSKVLAALDKQK